MPAKKNKIKIIIFFVLAILLLFTAFSIWLYTGSLTKIKSKAFSSLPLPIAFVGWKPIFMNQINTRLTLSKNLSQIGIQTDSNIKINIYNNLIKEATLGIISNKEGVYVSQQEVNNTFKDVSEQTSLYGKPDFKALLDSIGLNENSYKSNIIKPELQETQLKIWFYNNRNLNQDTYKKAEQILNQIDQGQDIVFLAKNYSQDELEKSVSGDLGFLDPSELLPELREKVSNMKNNDTRILSTRYGIHIIHVEETNGNKLHLREIFLNGDNFQNWYNLETKKIKIIKLINL